VKSVVITIGKSKPLGDSMEISKKPTLNQEQTELKIKKKQKDKKLLKMKKLLNE